jgi:hypothetical protein
LSAAAALSAGVLVDAAAAVFSLSTEALAGFLEVVEDDVDEALASRSARTTWEILCCSSLE